MSDALSEHDVFRDEFETNVDVIAVVAAVDDGTNDGLPIFLFIWHGFDDDAVCNMSVLCSVFFFSLFKIALTSINKSTIRFQ